MWHLDVLDKFPLPNSFLTLRFVKEHPQDSPRKVEALKKSPGKHIGRSRSAMLILKEKAGACPEKRAATLVASMFLKGPDLDAV